MSAFLFYCASFQVYTTCVDQTTLLIFPSTRRSPAEGLPLTAAVPFVRSWLLTEPALPMLLPASTSQPSLSRDNCNKVLKHQGAEAWLASKLQPINANARHKACLSCCGRTNQAHAAFPERFLRYLRRREAAGSGSALSGGSGLRTVKIQGYLSVLKNSLRMYRSHATAVAGSERNGLHKHTRSLLRFGVNSQVCNRWRFCKSVRRTACPSARFATVGTLSVRPLRYIGTY